MKPVVFSWTWPGLQGPAGCLPTPDAGAVTPRLKSTVDRPCFCRFWGCLPWGAHKLVVLLACLIGLPAAAEDLDLKPLGGWPEDAFGGYLFGTYMALAGGKVIANGTHRPPLPEGDRTGWGPSAEGRSRHHSVEIGRLAVAGRYALVMEGDPNMEEDRLFVVDLVEPSQPKVAGMLLMERGVLAVSGTRAYVVHGTFPGDQPDAPPARITVVDFSDPTQPKVVGEGFLPAQPDTHRFSLFGAAADDGLLCIASLSADEDWAGKFALDVFDIANAASPRWVGRHKMVAPAEVVSAIAVAGRRAYWASWWIPNVGRRSNLEVIDLTDPVSPRLLGTYSTRGEATSMAVNGPHLYLAKEVFSADLNRIAVDIVDTSDPAAPRRVGGFTSSTFDAGPSLAVEGTLAVVNSRSGVTSYDISNPAVMTPVAVRRRDYVAYDMAVSGSRAFLGGEEEVKILDISQPQAPRLLGTFRPGNVVWQVAAAGDYAYLAASYGGVQTLDVSNPVAPRRTSTFRSGSYFYTVAVEGRLLATAGNEGLFLLDVTDPSRPVSRGRAGIRYPNSGTKSVAMSGHHVFVVSNDRWGSKTGVLEIFDASNPADPQPVASYEVPAVARDVAVSGQLAVVTSFVERWPAENALHADILDVSDPANPSLLAQHTELRGGDSEFMATVTLTGNRAILGGRQVLDLSDPRKPEVLVDLGPTVFGTEYGTLAGDVLWAGSYLRGLQSYRVSTATLPRARTLAVEQPVLGVAPQGDLAWLALGEAGLQAVDRRSPDASARLGHLPLDGKAWGVVSAGTLALVAAGEVGLVIVDTTDPANPQPLGVLDTPGEARAVAVSGTTACVADASGGVRVVDVSHPASPRELAGFATPGPALALVWHGSHAWVACREAGLQVLHLADPAQPQLVGGFLVRGAAEAVALSGHHAYLADGVEGFLVLDVSDPARPRRVGLAPGPYQARSITVSGRFAYVADAVRGIRVFDVGEPTRPREVGGTAAVNAHQLAVTGDRLLAAGGMGGLAEFEFFVAPVALGIVHSGSTVTLTWPASALGFQLESSPALAPMADWQPEATASAIVGEQKVVTLEIGAGPRFFRLKKP
ncbi:MAG: hypothetical protein HS113_07150 [Verrucomicrobiales bacterium]|nr:hypothetical protein [Verrucomicrobiales bacterium]